MVTSILWAAGFALESLILLRSLKGRFFRHYPVFFVYMALVWTTSVALLPAYGSAAYANTYWALEFLTLLAGFAVLLELVQKSFDRYAGAKNFSTTVLVGMFVILCAYCGFKLITASPLSLYENFADLERDFRTVQALALAGILAVIAYYRIDLGRNLRGIIFGFGLYVGTIVLSHALRGYAGPSFDAAWANIQPYTYLVSLLIWAAALWSYAPAPLPQPASESSDDYEGFARRTKERLEAMRAGVSRAEHQ